MCVSFKRFLPFPLVSWHCQLHFEGPLGTHPLLMACPTHHVIDITRSSGPSTSSSSPHDRHANDVDFDVLNSRTRHQGDNVTRRSPLNSGLWIFIELMVTMCQIVASIVVLSLSKHEHPHAPLFAWVIGYASGCVSTLPLLYWRYYHNNYCLLEHNTSGTLLSDSVTNGGEDVIEYSRSNQDSSWLMNARLKLCMEYYKIIVDCFFIIWFVVGNVWVFGGHSSAVDAPNLYRLCVIFLTFNGIGYAVPFILCTTICCCLPCIISVLGIREDMSQTRGATSESINALPTYKFQVNKNKGKEENNLVVSECGAVAVGTEKERIIFGEDAVCCICLTNYEHDDELRELPCSHLFHKDCVDKWLKINALCPLCKSEICENVTEPIFEENANQQHGQNRVESSLINDNT